MSELVRESYVDEIRVPDDLDAIGIHDQINQALVNQRAAGSIRIIEDLEASNELVNEIKNAVTSDHESITLILDARKHHILTISRRLGGMATPDPTLQ